MVLAEQHQHLTEARLCQDRETLGGPQITPRTLVKYYRKGRKGRKGVRIYLIPKFLAKAIANLLRVVMLSRSEASLWRIKREILRSGCGLRSG
jgi:hypothetical protein